MKYNLSKNVSGEFNSVKNKVTEAFSKEGFGIITEINLKDKFKEKLDVEFREYTILGACNPKLAYEAIQEETNIGVMLPCNILIQQHENGSVEVTAINPVASIGSVGNENLEPLASEVSSKLNNVMGCLQ